MADNFLAAIQTGIQMGHAIDTAKMQRAQMERMAAQMQMEAVTQAMQVSAFQQAQQEKTQRKAVFAPETTKPGGDEYTGPMAESVPGGPGREALKAQFPDSYNILADQMLNFGKIDPGYATLVKGNQAKPESPRVMTPGSVLIDPKNPTTPLYTAPTAPQAGKEPTPPMFVDVNVTKDTKQKYKWNPETKVHDIKVGEAFREGMQTGEFRPGTLDYMVEMYETTGQVPSFGMGSVGAKQRADFYDKVAERARSRGDMGSEQAARSASFKSNSMALNDLTKREQLIESFNVRINSTSDKILIPLIKKYDLRNPRWANIPVNKLNELMGSGDLASLKLALNSVSQEIAKVEFNALGIAQLTDAASKFMAGIHDPSIPVGELIKVIDTGKSLGKTATDAIAGQRSELISRIRGGINQPNPAPGNPTPPPTQPSPTKPTHKWVPGKGLVPVQ